MSDFEITTEGASQTTILRRDGLPIARFYAGRFNSALLNFITERLNTSPDPMKELCEALEAAVANFGDGEINTSNYSHDDVCHLNDQYVNLFSAVKSLTARTALENAKGGGR